MGIPARTISSDGKHRQGRRASLVKFVGVVSAERYVQCHSIVKMNIEGGHIELDNYNFKSILKETYIKDPCKVLPNALWKTIDRIDKLECSVKQTDNKEINVQGWDKNGLHIFWNESREMEIQYINRVEHSDFAIIHDDYFQKINHDEFRVIKPYFRIKHECNKISEYCLDERFSIVNVDIKAELNEVSELICKCYEDIHPSNEIVRQWTESRVFDNNLWIWIIDRATNTPIGLGIADLDSSVSEGSLEWIQVLPEYQGNGLGKVLVLELLSRMHYKVDFVTVSGEANNVTNPERLYRSCGFYGDDMWWLLRR